QGGRLTQFVGRLARGGRPATIGVGGPGFHTDLRRTSGLPENDNEWTAAVFSGPRDVVGEPRRIAGPASHVDMLPTVLAFAGDRRRSAALGRNLFGPPRGATPSAFSVRPGGLRLDRDGYSVMVDARTPNATITRVPFPELAPPSTDGGVPELTATRLTDWIADWSYLIEKNRVWNQVMMPR